MTILGLQTGKLIRGGNRVFMKKDADNATPSEEEMQMGLG